MTVEPSERQLSLLAILGALGLGIALGYVFGGLGCATTPAPPFTGYVIGPRCDPADGRGWVLSWFEPGGLRFELPAASLDECADGWAKRIEQFRGRPLR